MARHILVALTLLALVSAGAGDPPTLPSCADQCATSLFPSCTESAPAQCVCDGTASNPEMGMAFGQCIFTNCGVSEAESVRGEIFSYCGIPSGFGGFPGFSGFATSAVVQSTGSTSASSGSATQPLATTSLLAATTSAAPTRHDTTGRSLQATTALDNFTKSFLSSPSRSASATTTHRDGSAALETPTAAPTGGFTNSPTAAAAPGTDTLGIGAKVGIGISIAIIALLLIAILILLVRHRQVQRGHVPFTALEKAFPDGSPSNGGPSNAGAGSVMSGGSMSSIPNFMDPNSSYRQNHGLTEARYYEADSRPQPMYHEVEGKPFEAHELPGAMAKRSYRSMLVELPNVLSDSMGILVPDDGGLERRDDLDQSCGPVASPQLLDNSQRPRQPTPSSGRPYSQEIRPARHSLVDALWRNRRTIAHPPSPPSISPTASSASSKQTPDVQSGRYFEPSRRTHLGQNQPDSVPNNLPANTSSPTNSSSISPIDETLSSERSSQQSPSLQARAVRLLRLNSNVPRAEDDFVSPMSATPS